MAYNSDLNGIPGAGKGSQIVLTGTANTASTNTAIRFYSTVVKITGVDITYVPNAVLGDSFIINTEGAYHFHKLEFSTNDTSFHATGFSINSNQLTTNVDGIRPENLIGYNAHSIASTPVHFSGSWYCYPGDVVRSHVRSGLIDSVSTNVIVITKSS